MLHIITEKIYAFGTECWINGKIMTLKNVIVLEEFGTKFKVSAEHLRSIVCTFLATTFRMLKVFGTIPCVHTSMC